MATLVLTAVGGVIGGPIGAALGGLAGQALDARVLGKAKGRQGPRLTELAVQTSSYGTPIAKLFGTIRVAGTVIWSTDLRESRSKSRGGKGQPATTTYSYSVSFAVALSGRPIQDIGRIWADGKLLRGAAGDFKSACGMFRLHRGDEDQSVDPLIAAAEGNATPAYRGMAYALFEDLQLADFGNRIPSLTFEVIADPDAVAPGSIAAALSGGLVEDAAQELRLAGYSAYGDSIRGVMEPLVQASGGWFFETDGRLVMRDGADVAAIATIDDAGVSGPQRARAIAPIETVPRTLTIAHYDPAREYQAGAQTARRPGAGQREERVELPAVIDAGQAKSVAEAMLLRAEVGRVRREIALDARALAIVPGTIVTIDGEAGSWRVASAELERMAVKLSLVPLAIAPQPAVASAGRALPAPDRMIGQTLLSAFEMPPLGDELLTQPRLTIAAAGTASGWRQAVLLYSLDDGASWIEAGATIAPAIIGSLLTPLKPAPATLIDMHDTIELALAHGEMMLVGSDPAGIDRGVNLALVGDELIQFEHVDEIAPGRWRLSGLRRGLRGTSPCLHVAGAGFVLLEQDSSMSIALPASMVGRSVRVMASGVGDDEPVEVSAAIDGRSFVPPAPVHLRREQDTLRWTRRSRIGWHWLDGIDAPLGEESERYRVAITTEHSQRTVVVDTPSLMLGADEIASSALSVTVRQLGTNGESPTAVLE